MTIVDRTIVNLDFVIFATRLQNLGCRVDFKLPWAQEHGGDYDLDELFAWVEEICR